MLTGAISIGAAIGTSGSDALISEINREMGGSSATSTMASMMDAGTAKFIDNYITPIRKAVKLVKRNIKNFCIADKFIVVEKNEQLANIPVCMQEGILAYEPVKLLFDKGRVYGFGFESAPEEDVFGRLIQNGRAEDINDDVKAGTPIVFTSTFKSTDPDVDFDEIDAMEATRKFLDKFLDETDFDPTDYPNTRG